MWSYANTALLQPLYKPVETTPAFGVLEAKMYGLHPQVLWRISDLPKHAHRLTECPKNTED